jgi:hypothetical protein
MLRSRKNRTEALRQHYYTADPEYAKTMQAIELGFPWHAIAQRARNRSRWSLKTD